jgi:hypothetical protein
MQPREGQLFAARVPAEIAGNDFEYFLEAFDEDGNGPFRKGSPEAPLRISSLPPAPPPLDLRGTTPQQTGRPLRATGIGLLTVGGAALLAGAVSGGLAVVAHNSEADAAARYDQPAYDSARSRYHSSLLAMDVLLPLGGTLAVTGAVLMVVSSMKEKPGPVSFNLSSDGRGATAMISGAF